MRFSSPFSPTLLLALPFITLASAASNTLWSEQAAYCATPDSGIFVRDIDLTYYRQNNSINFWVTVQNTQANNNVRANVYINAYNIELINRNIDICSFANGIFCPLPVINVSAFGTFQLPSDVDIPAIAYSVPDLEAYARIELLREDGTVALCVQTTLTNGLTTELLAVKIATGAFTAIALLIGLFHGLANTASPAQYRWFDILFLFQAAAATGFLNLNYPNVYRAFTRNFAWAHSLFTSPGMQGTINEMRFKTGGYLSGGINSGLATIPRSSAPYSGYVNVNQIIDQIQALSGALGGLFGRSLQGRAFTGTVAGPTAGLTRTFTNTGIPAYLSDVGIPYPNAITTVFFFFLAFVGIFLLFHGIVYIIARTGGRSIWAQDLRRKFWAWMAGNALLTCLMWSFPIWIFAFWQFRIRDSSLAIFWGVFAIALTLFPLLTALILSIFKARKRSSASPGVSNLYTKYGFFHSVGALYRPYRQKFHWFWFVFVLAIIARSGFIAFGPSDGFAQVIGCVVVEAIVFVGLLVARPHKDKKGDWLVSFLAFCRMAAFGLLIAFLPRLNVAPITRTIIGFVVIVLFGIPVILLLLGLIFNLGYGWLWRRHHDRIEDGMEVERYVASEDSSLRPAMVQTQPPSPPGDGTYVDPNAHNHRVSLIEPVTEHDTPSRSYTGVGAGYNATSRSRPVSGESYGGVASTNARPLSTGSSTRTGQTQYFTPMEDNNYAGQAQGDQRRWSRDQYFDSGNQNPSQSYVR